MINKNNIIFDHSSMYLISFLVCLKIYILYYVVLKVFKGLMYTNWTLKWCIKSEISIWNGICDCATCKWRKEIASFVVGYPYGFYNKLSCENLTIRVEIRIIYEFFQIRHTAFLKSTDSRKYWCQAHYNLKPNEFSTFH